MDKNIKCDANTCIYNKEGYCSVAIEIIDGECVTCQLKNEGI